MGAKVLLDRFFLAIQNLLQMNEAYLHRRNVAKPQVWDEGGKILGLNRFRTACWG